MSDAKTIAIVGASTNPTKYGHKALKAYQRAGFVVYPVHPTASEIAGLSAYPSLAEVPKPIDRVSLYVPPEVGIGLLEEIAQAAPNELWLNPGSESPELVARAEGVGLETIQACSIVAAGMNPATL